MKKKQLIIQLLPILFGFFVMGFCDIVGFSSDYVQRAFGWSSAMTGFVPSLVFIWFLFLGIPVGNLMNRWGRKNTVLLSLGLTLIGMFLPLLVYNSFTCMGAYAFLGIGNAILQVSLNPLLANVVRQQRLLTSSLTAGQVIKAVSSFVGSEIVLLAISRFGDDKWYYCFPILGCVTLLSGLWLAATPIAREKESGSQSVLSLGDTFLLLKDRTILILFLGIFFVVGLDVSTNFISSKLMVARFDWSVEASRLAPQLYFLSRTTGALLGTFLLARLSGRSYFRVNIVACSIAVLTLVFINDELISLAAIAGIGFFASSVFSIIYSMALQIRVDKANQISGLMITAISGGGIVTPLMGAAIGSVGITGGVWVVFACVIYLCFCAFARYQKS